MNADSLPAHDPSDFGFDPHHHLLDGSQLAQPMQPDLYHRGAEYGSLGSFHSPQLEGVHPVSDHSSFHQNSLGDKVIGEVDDGGVWHQQETSFTCAVVSQQMILKEFGLDVSEARLMGEGMENGWLSRSGTPFEDVGKLLELHGVPCHEGQGIEQMVSELAQGHKLIVGVDSSDLWYGHFAIFRGLHDLFADGAADHAIVVQGLRQDDHGDWHVVVNDPGAPDGGGHEYPLDQFTDAWEGSKCHFTATDAAPPGLASHPEYGHGFDEQAGSYTGVMDWLKDHAHAFSAASIGLAAMARQANQPKNEMERNEALRNL